MRLLSLLFPVLALSSPLLSQGLPPLPWIARGACPFECCQLGHWTTGDSVRLFAREADSTAGYVLLPRAARLLADSGNLHTVSLGIVVLGETTDLATYVLDPPFASFASRDQAPTLQPNDTAYVTGHVPELGMTVWVRGKEFLVEDFWWEPELLREYPNVPHRPGILVQPLREEWWVHVFYGERSGWLDEYHSAIDGADACG